MISQFTYYMRAGAGVGAESVFQKHLKLLKFERATIERKSGWSHWRIISPRLEASQLGGGKLVLPQETIFRANF